MSRSIEIGLLQQPNGEAIIPIDRPVATREIPAREAALLVKYVAVDNPVTSLITFAALTTAVIMRYGDYIAFGKRRPPR